jgi:hypothetical protein
MRILFALALGLLLSGCNGVYSDIPLAGNLYVDKPVFLRPGIWKAVVRDCKLEKPGGRDCDSPDVVFDRTGHGAFREQEGTYKLVFAPGDPGLIQVRQPKSKPSFVYLGARPSQFDEKGQVAALSLWVVQCGPLPDRPIERKPNGETSLDSKVFVTERPYPGLVLRGSYCIATDVAAVRAAARASEDPNLMTLRWVAER